MCYLRNPLRGEVDIIPHNLEVSHSSHPEPLSYHAVSGPTAQVSRMSPDSMMTMWNSRAICPVKAFLTSAILQSWIQWTHFYPTLLLTDFQDYTTHLGTKASLHACPLYCTVRAFKERDHVTLFS